MTPLNLQSVDVEQKSDLFEKQSDESIYYIVYRYVRDASCNKL